MHGTERAFGEALEMGEKPYLSADNWVSVYPLYAVSGHR